VRLPFIDRHQQDVGECGHLYINVYGLCGYCTQADYVQASLTHLPCLDFFDGLQPKQRTTMTMMTTIMARGATTLTTHTDERAFPPIVSEDAEHCFVTT
jgi:hypothetical protein